LRDEVKDERERGALESAMESMQEIIAAAGKLPADAPETGKPKKRGR
jgi:hypothetical protein